MFLIPTTPQKVSPKTAWKRLSREIWQRCRAFFEIISYNYGGSWTQHAFCWGPWPSGTEALSSRLVGNGQATLPESDRGPCGREDMHASNLLADFATSPWDKLGPRTFLVARRGGCVRRGAEARCSPRHLQIQQGVASPF